MSKKHNKPQQETPAPQPAVQPPPQAPAPEAQPPVSNARIWTFWGGVLATLLTARILDVLLPSVPERIIERWVMLGFAAFVGVFLYKLK